MIIRTAKQPYFDDFGRTVVEHADIDDKAPSKFFGVATQGDQAGRPIGQQMFPIEAPTIEGAFANHDKAFADFKDDFERQKRRAILLQGAVNGSVNGLRMG